MRSISSAASGSFGLMNGMGSAGREYVPGVIHRSDRMASTGLYDDGKKGIRRLTEVPMRLKDQDRDGVQAEVLYGVLGSSGRLNDPEAALEMLRIYNDWLHDFCQRRARAAGRAGQHSQLQHGRVGGRDDAQRQARRARLRRRQPAGHDAAVGSVLGAAVAVRARDRHPRALPHDRRALARLLEDAAVRRAPCRRPRTSPASRCTWATC